MHVQKNAQGEDEAVGSIHHQQLEAAGVSVAPYNEQVRVEQQSGPITALGVPPSTELANQEPAGGESVTTADVNAPADEAHDEVLSERNTREELDAEAERRGLNPEDYSNKREVLDAIEEHDEANA